MTTPGDLPVPGWYADGVGTIRWWDGAEWTEAAQGTTSAPLTRVRTVPTRFLAPLVWALGLGWAVAFTVALTALLSGQPVSGASTLLIVGVPLLIVGQLASLAGQYEARMARGNKRLRLWREPGAHGEKSVSSLPTALRRTLQALVFVTVLLGVDAAVADRHNYQLLPATTACSYPVVDSGTWRCLTAAEWGDRRADPEQFAAAIFAGFFLAQGALTLEIRAKRKSAEGGTDRTGVVPV